MTYKKCKYCIRFFLPNTPRNIACSKCSYNSYKIKKLKEGNNFFQEDN